MKCSFSVNLAMERHTVDKNVRIVHENGVRVLDLKLKAEEVFIYFLPWMLSTHCVTADERSYSAFISSGTPPTNRWVSRLRPSVPRGLSPSMCGSLSTLSMALRRLRVTTSWCQRPWSICTLLTTVPVPEPVLNLRRGDTTAFGGGYFPHICFILYQAAPRDKEKCAIIARPHRGWWKEGTEFRLLEFQTQAHFCIQHTRFWSEVLLRKTPYHRKELWCTHTYGSISTTWEQLSATNN